jgi:hypothetical protein
MTEYAQQPCERKTEETDLEGVSKSVPLYALLASAPADPAAIYEIQRTWRQVRQGVPIRADTPIQLPPEPAQ